MPVLTVFEHEYTEGFDWSERDCAALERMRRATGVEILRPTVRAGRRELQAAEQVGVVRLGARTVQILPKIHRAARGASESERAAEATRNLLHMLAHAGQLPVREHELAPLLRRGADWFEILTRLFAAHLLEAWQRGAHRHYRTVEEELPVLKGKWLIAEQLRRPARRHAFAVAHDEFTADNQLNRVLRFVVERHLHFAWYRRVVPLLQEYFYNDGERLKAVIGGRFVRPVKMSATGAAFKELYDAEQPPHEVVELQGEEFLEALRALAGAAADVETEANA